LACVIPAAKLRMLFWNVSYNTM